jgi:uncharacterized cupredoxin-like copper-binding protein
MTSLENFYKLRCAALQDQKQKLLEQLKLLDESITAAQASGSADSGSPQGQYGQQMQSAPSQMAKKTGRKSRRKQEEGQEETAEMQPEQDPFDPKSQHGFEPYGVGEYGLRDVLQRFSDNPQTQEIEMPEKATWQATNTAIGNYMTGEVERLKRMHGMI